MALLPFISNPAWDAPFFKRLANNDTGQAIGHQGGIVVPKDLRQFFPVLIESSTSALSPTTDTRLMASLFDGETLLDTVETRYQLQTWGGTRSAESRLTDNLPLLRNLAQADDILIFQRDTESLTEYRLILVRHDNSAFSEVSAKAGPARWGLLDPTDPPLTEKAFSDAISEEAKREAQPFSLFDKTALLKETKQMRFARSAAFRKKIYSLYAGRCSVCDTCLVTPTTLSELEAAHIVPRNIAGADDARNGLGLCKRHHWAFDKGLYGIDRTGNIFVPSVVQSLVGNEPLHAFHKQAIRLPAIAALRPHPTALEWHWNNILVAKS